MRLNFRQLLDRWLNRGFWIKLVLVILISFSIFFLAAIIITALPIEVPFCNYVGNDDIFWQLYYYFADPGNQMSIGQTDLTMNLETGANCVSSSARWIGLIISTLGSIFLSGILISTITNSFERISESWRSGFSYYKLKNHTIIIGSDQMVYGLVNQICESSNDTIVVMTSTDVEQTRNALWASLKNKKNKNRIVVNYGHRDSEIFLKKINIAHANEVYLLGDTSEFDNIESYHDSLNVQSLKLISEQCKAAGRTNRLKCHVLFDYKTTYHIFQYADLNTDITKYIDFHPFNFYDFWARKVLVAGRSKEGNIVYKPLDYIPITSKDSDKFIHLIVIGMSQMGQAMALQAAHIAHFPNYHKNKTKITFIDANGMVEMHEFKQKCGELFKVSHSTFIDADACLYAELNNKKDKDLKFEEMFTTEYHIANEYKHLVSGDNKNQDFIDVEWEFIKGHDHNPVVQRLLNKYIDDENAIITVAVCLNITHMSLRSAMSLPKKYYENKVPILVQQRKTATMASTLNGEGFEDSYKQNLLYENLKPFGMVSECYDIQMVSSIEICKRISYAYDHFSNYNNLAVQIDMAKANQIWDNTVISKRWSNIFAAASIPTKLRCIGHNWDINSHCDLDSITEEQVSMLAEIEHNRWNIEELLLGYRPVYKNEDDIIDADKNRKKEYKNRFIHYDIRPFNELKTDNSGRKANEYDEVIVRSLPLILKS